MMGENIIALLGASYFIGFGGNAFIAFRNGERKQAWCWLLAIPLTVLLIAAGLSTLDL